MREKKYVGLGNRCFVTITDEIKPVTAYNAGRTGFFLFSQYPVVTGSEVRENVVNE
jgi:hypothetical protein